MSRAEMLAQYRPIRAGIRRVLREAVKACGRADMDRAIKQVLPWAGHQELHGQAIDMVADVALFEANQRGRRAYDRFLAGRASGLEAADRALAERMSAAWFSVFRVAGRHEVAGMWLEDMLADDRRLWLMDEGFETCATEGLVFAMRLFDAGSFHAGFGIVAQPDEDTLEFCLTARPQGGRGPFRHSLAATLYSDELREEEPLGPADIALLETLLHIPGPELDLLAAARPRAESLSGPRRLPQPRDP